jgi:biotin carboxyl carrier protein
MEFRYWYRDSGYSVLIEPGRDGTFTARIGDRTYQIKVLNANRDELSMLVDGKRIRAYTTKHLVADRDVHLVALAGRDARQFELVRIEPVEMRRARSHVGSSALEAQMPGQVTKVFVSEGDAVKAGQPLLILEAMKMETRVSAQVDGIVKHLMVAIGDTVERGQQLAEVVPDEPDPNRS